MTEILTYSFFFTPMPDWNASSRPVEETPFLRKVLTSNVSLWSLRAGQLKPRTRSAAFAASLCPSGAIWSSLREAVGWLFTSREGEFTAAKFSLFFSACRDECTRTMRAFNRACPQSTFRVGCSSGGKIAALSENVISAFFSRFSESPKIDLGTTT